MIGVFDSGYGGLTIFRDIEKKLPNYNYIYLGDNARAPYGDLDQETIYRYSCQAVDELFNRGCKLIIFACNTISASALRKIQQEYLIDRYSGKNVLGVIRPLVETVVSLKKNSKVGVMATHSTVESRAYINEFAKFDRNIEVFQQACPLLVPLIEDSRENTPETSAILIEYIRPLKSIDLEAVVLGCTHYGWLQESISRGFGKQTIVLDSGQIIANKLVSYIKRHPQYDKPVKNPKRIFLTTGDNSKFDVAAEKFLGRKIKSLKIKIK